MEKCKVDDQLDRRSAGVPPAPDNAGGTPALHPALRLIAGRPDVFSRQGHVAASYRRRDGKTFGPYYRLSYREDGRQCSIYLGRAGELVERVRGALLAVQQHLKQYRLLDRLKRQIRASLRIQKLNVARLLCPFGLRFKGREVRGWRISPLRTLLVCRRRLMPRVALRRLHRKRREKSTPKERLERFVEARDGPRRLAQ